MDVLTASMRALKAFLSEPVPTQLAAFSPAEPRALVTDILAGWPDPEQELEYPALSIDAPVVGDRFHHAPLVLELRDVTGDATKVDLVVGLATVTQPLNLEVFAASRAARAKVVGAIEAAFGRAQAQDLSSATVVSPDYFGRPISFRRAGPAYFPDLPNRVNTDEWHARVPVEAETEEIVIVRYPRLRTLHVGLVLCTSILGGIEGTPEYRTIFAPPAP